MALGETIERSEGELRQIENNACFDATGSLISWGATGDRERKKALKDKEKELKAKLTGVP